MSNYTSKQILHIFLKYCKWDQEGYTFTVCRNTDLEYYMEDDDYTYVGPVCVDMPSLEDLARGGLKYAQDLINEAEEDRMRAVQKARDYESRWLLLDAPLEDVG